MGNVRLNILYCCNLRTFSLIDIKLTKIIEKIFLEKLEGFFLMGQCANKLETIFVVCTAVYIVTRLGDFLKFLVTNLLTKVRQNIADVLAYFEKDLF